MNPSAKRITIGRKPGNTIVLNTHDVSGTHASLTLVTPVTNTWEIQDLGSANGTFVDGMRVYRKEITPANQIKLGQTMLSWELILDPRPLPPVVPVMQTAKVPEPEEPSAEQEEIREIAWNLKKVSDDFREKRNRIAEIQAQESINSRIQGLGFPMGAVIGSLAQALPPDYKIFGYAGGVISLGFAVSALISSKKLSKEKKTYTGLDDWYKINYVCPHCHTFIQQPFELLEKTKNCRACKKPLIP
ncbi:FHA domain-containing protein [Dyadobacter fanqingshengii]|uniref:FHA domain-containing protein n=1 Tax=Dyadobacter fanqingshengii TaxID=2906443 RepID=A0A9X1P9A6_9BACT|nr:FHA domain-containing protein [Dyadobacter fanqingshengii]MCF0040049.1 FHA domain-containing protein [Dyadobacter fanqingshengii]USJ38199.1 FHA domain-containing protein [Dyadobacter fanqingshengii]